MQILHIRPGTFSRTIENSFHWILDVHFRENLSMSKKDNAVINFATVRKFCYNLTKFNEKLKYLILKRRLASYQYDIKNIESLAIISLIAL